MRHTATPALLAAALLSGCVFDADPYRTGDLPDPGGGAPPVTEPGPDTEPEPAPEPELARCTWWGGFCGLTIDLPDHAEATAWRWSEDVQSVGGLVRTASGRFGGHTLHLDPDSFAGGLVGQSHVGYGALPEPTAAPVRVWHDGTPVDLIAVGDDRAVGLEIWTATRGVERADFHDWDVDVPAWTDLDAVVDGDVLTATACGSDALRWLELDLATGETLRDVEVPSDVTRCRLMTLGSSMAVVVDADVDGHVTVLAPATDGFTEVWTVPSAYDHFVTSPNGRWLAGISDGDVRAELPDGTFRIYDAEAVGEMALAVDDTGDIVLAWHTADDTVRVNVGDPELGTLPLTIGDVPVVHDLAVGLSATEAVVSIWDGEALRVYRRRR